VKTDKRMSLMVAAAALVTLAVGQPLAVSAETAARWSVQVAKVDAGEVNLSPSFQVAIYENLLRELNKTKQFKQVLRDGDHTAADTADLLVLKTTVEKYAAGSETRRAVTTVTGATKLTVRTQLSTRDGKIVLERTVNGNVRFMGSNLRATHNLARNVAKAIKKSPLAEPASPTLSQEMGPGSSDDVVVVELR
jgi:hypothetical protein